jgi:hypothetical protein
MYSLYYAEDYYSFYTFLVENVFINMHWFFFLYQGLNQDSLLLGRWSTTWELCPQFYICCILSNTFSVYIEIGFSSFVMLISCIIFLYLHIYNHNYILETNSTGSWCMILRIAIEVNLLLFCWWVFHIYISLYWSENFFSCSVLVWIWYQDNDDLIKWVCECYHFFQLLRVLRLLTLII